MILLELSDNVVVQVSEACLHCSEEERDEVLYYLLAAHPGRTIVFVNAVSTARRVAALLKLLKMPSSALHAGALHACHCCFVNVALHTMVGLLM